MRCRVALDAFGPVSLVPLVIHGAAFDLTPAEARVAAQICAGAGVKSVAGSLGVAASTVTCQLQRVFEKVGVSRQGELAAALAGLRVIAQTRTRHGVGLCAPLCSAEGHRGCF